MGLLDTIGLQVWVKPELRGDGLVYWAADSDSQLTKGLAALLVNGLSGCTPQEILQVGGGGSDWLCTRQTSLADPGKASSDLVGKVLHHECINRCSEKNWIR